MADVTEPLRLELIQPDPTITLIEHLADQVGIDAFLEFVARRFGMNDQHHGEITIELRFRNGHFTTGYMHRKIAREDLTPSDP